MVSQIFYTPLFAVSTPQLASTPTDLNLEALLKAVSSKKISLLSFTQIQCWYPKNISDILDDETYDEEMRKNYKEYLVSMKNFSDEKRFANVLSGLHKDFAIIKGDFDNDYSDDLLIEDKEFKVHFFSGRAKELFQVFPDQKMNRMQKNENASSTLMGKAESWDHVPIEMTFSANELIFYFAPETDFRGVYRIEKNKLIDVDDPYSP